MNLFEHLVGPDPTLPLKFCASSVTDMMMVRTLLRVADDATLVAGGSGGEIVAEVLGDYGDKSLWENGGQGALLHFSLNRCSSFFLSFCLLIDSCNFRLAALRPICFRLHPASGPGPRRSLIGSME